MPDEDQASCWLCARTVGSVVEYHHPVPKSRGGRETVPIHPICHRTLHRTFSNAELGAFGDSVAMIRADRGSGASSRGSRASTRISTRRRTVGDNVSAAGATSRWHLWCCAQTGSGGST